MTNHPQSPRDRDHDLDPALDQTRRTLHRLYADQQQHPDDAFVRQLEATLMPNSAATPAPQPGVRGAIDRIGDGIQLRGPDTRRRLSWAHSTISVALLITLVVASLAVVIRYGGTGDGGRPSQMAFAPDGTPVPTEQAAPHEPGVLWRVPFYAGDNIDSGGMVLANGTIYRLAASSTFTGIEAVNATDGALLWSRETSWTTGSMASAATGANPIAADDERIYIFGAPNQVNALDAESGELVWSHDIASTGITVEVDNGQLIVWDLSRAVYLIDSETGDDIWVYGAPELGPERFTATSPFVTDELVLTITAPGELTALNRDTGDISGEVLWHYDDTFDPLNVSFAEVDGSIILQGDNWETGNLETPRRNIVVALDATNGSVIWREEIASDPITNIAESGNSLFIIATDPEPGDATPTPVASPAPEVSGVMWPNVVQALDVATGDVRWTSDKVSSFYRHLFELADGTVMAMTNDAEMIGFSPETGDQVCALYQLPEYPLNNVITDGEAIYLSLIDGSLVALDPSQLCATSE